MQTEPTPTIPGSFAIQQQDPDATIYILGPEPQNRIIARIEEGTMEDARLLTSSRTLLKALREIQANPNDPRCHRHALDAIKEAIGTA